MTTRTQPTSPTTPRSRYATVAPEDSGAGELVHPRELKSGDRFLFPFGAQTLVLDVMGDRVPSPDRFVQPQVRFLAASGDLTGWMIFAEPAQRVQRYDAA